MKSKFEHYKEIGFEEDLYPHIDGFKKQYERCINEIPKHIPKFVNTQNIEHAYFLLYNTLNGVKEKFLEYDIPIHYNFHFGNYNIHLHIWIDWKEYFNEKIWNDYFVDWKNNKKHYNNGDALTFIDYQLLKDTQKILREDLDINFYEVCSLFFVYRDKFEKIINYYPKFIEGKDHICVE